MRSGFILDVSTHPQGKHFYNVEVQTQNGRVFRFLVMTYLELNIGDDVKWDQDGLCLVLEYKDPNDYLLASLDTLEGPVRVARS